jgi:hypothetical protein
MRSCISNVFTATRKALPVALAAVVLAVAGAPITVLAAPGTGC